MNNEQKNNEKQSQTEPLKKENQDVEQNKLMAVVGYIIPILFFVPLLSDAKNSPFAKFHANQQLNLLLTSIVVNVAGVMIPFLGWFIILPLGSVLVFILAIVGVIKAYKGEMKKLPIIGEFQLIK